MKQKSWRWIAGLGLLLAAGLTIGQQQKVDIQPVDGGPGAIPVDPGDGSAVSLPRDNKMKSRVEAAQDYIKSRDWAEACNVLQKLVEIKEDVFAEIPRKGPDGKDAVAIVSVRTEANRLIASLPPKGLEFYKLTFNPPAAAWLKEARATGDPNLLAQIVRQYLHTEAGGEAAALLGTYHLDRGNFMAASLCFERLLERDGSNNLSPRALFKAAFAFFQAGDMVRGQKIWQMLTAKGLKEINLGGESFPLEELRVLATKVTRAHDAGVHDWLLFGGNPRRNAEAPGGTAFMEPRWKTPTLRTDETRTWLRMAENYLVQQRAQAMIPAFFPLAVTINRNEQKLPLLVYRSYWGLHAVQLKTGKLEWEARSEWSADTVSREPRKAPVFQGWLTQYVQNNLRPAILFENSTLGSLSSDGKFVFAVEDLAIPPPPNLNNYNARPNTSSYGVASKDVLDAILHSKLQAYDLVTGKLKWEAGGRGEKGDLLDAYFLGPPLPVSGKLHVLTEKQQELRLATLDPASGKLLAMQTLVTTRDKLEQDIGRRTQAAHLAYGEGILVCPTNAGALLGVDLLTGSLVWAYMYRDKADGGDTTWDPNKNPGQMRGGIRRIDGRVANPNLNNQWKVTAPVIHEGRVIFTAPDARAIHCVNLRDGMKVWTQARQEEDLFFAGVHSGKALVVGRKMCRAIDLANGQTAWTVDTGVPSGMGVAFDNIYYLPLKEASGSKEPEICAIDISRGQILAHTRSRKKEVPGNLLFYEGEVLSQSTTELAAFPQLAVKLSQIDKLIQANPRDPMGLTERGELRLDKGDLRGAITDLKDALAQKPPAAVVEKARQKLFEAFTDYFQRDFNQAEPFLKEYEELCRVEIRPDATEKDKQEQEAEGKRRRANYLCLIAKGKEAQGRLVEAFEKYQEFAAIAPGDELISVIDEPSVRAAGEVWSQGRIAAMVANTSAENKKPLEDRIRLQWEELEKKGAPLAGLKKFVATCGSLFQIGQEARLRLAEKLLDDSDPNSLLLSEQHVQTVVGENPAMAARGFEILARLYTRKGLLDDAAWCYRKLGHDYPDAVVRDGRKGADFFNDLAADKRFLPFLSLSPVSVAKKIRVTEERGNFHQQTQTYRFESPPGELPYFQRHRLALRFDYHALRLTDTLTGDETWSKNLTRTLFQNLVYGNGQSHLVRFPLQAQGHLVLLPIGHLVFAIDPVSKRVLWEKNLYNPLGGLPGQAGIGSPPGYNQLNVDPDGTMRVLYPDGWGQRIGLTNPLTAGVAALQTRDGLVAVDPVTGKILWTRSDINSRAILFPQGKHIFVVEMSPENNPTATRALRAYDGVSVRIPDFSQQFAKRLRILGGALLLTDTEVNGAVTLRLYDVLSGKDTWKESFPAGSMVLKTEEEPELVGAVDPEGKVRAWRLPEGKLALNTRVETRHLVKGATAHLLADPGHFYLGFNGPVNANIMPWGGVQSNLMPGNGMRALPLNGEFYAFDRESGKMTWHNPLVNQMIVLDSFREMPVLIFTARFHKMMANGPVRNVVQVVAAKSFDKRTGKLLYDNENIPNGIQFHALNYDQRGGRIDFVNYQLKIIHHLEADTGKPATGGE
ncbi:MAG: tetratricopeptide repeat protein [Gemmataceae bacterium]|nr:tetratricopeptide repeat protein [Gemmataceae bacterium]